MVKVSESMADEVLTFPIMPSAASINLANDFGLLKSGNFESSYLGFFGRKSSSLVLPLLRFLFAGSLRSLLLDFILEIMRNNN